MVCLFSERGEVIKMIEKTKLKKIGKLSVEALFAPFLADVCPDICVREYLMFMHYILLKIKNKEMSYKSYKAVSVYKMIREFVFLGYLYEQSYEYGNYTNRSIRFLKKYRIGNYKNFFFERYSKLFSKYYRRFHKAENDFKRLYKISRHFDKCFIKFFLIKTR